MTIPFLKVRDNAKEPIYATKGAAQGSLFINRRGMVGHADFGSPRTNRTRGNENDLAASVLQIRQNPHQRLHTVQVQPSVVISQGRRTDFENDPFGVFYNVHIVNPFGVFCFLL